MLNKLMKIKHLQIREMFTYLNIWKENEPWLKLELADAPGC